MLVTFSLGLLYCHSKMLSISDMKPFSSPVLLANSDPSLHRVWFLEPGSPNCEGRGEAKQQRGFGVEGSPSSQILKGAMVLLELGGSWNHRTEARQHQSCRGQERSSCLRSSPHCLQIHVLVSTTAGLQRCRLDATRQHAAFKLVYGTDVMIRILH